ncbi:hypothetical protein PXH67_29265 [Streptomyces sp. P8-A8]|uniref:hypothetical protein n=1 Tax=Streptomyces sp. P8-A8 TaxID=3029759 RepID=UPI0036DF806D
MTPTAGHRRLQLQLVDLAVALSLTAVHAGFVRMGSGDGQAHYTGPLWTGYLIAAAVGLPVAVAARSSCWRSSSPRWPPPRSWTSSGSRTRRPGSAPTWSASPNPPGAPYPRWSSR